MSAKRKAAAAASANGNDGPDAKRRKLPLLEKETPETTTARGLSFITQMKQSRDKRNHLISTEFLTLPDKKNIPEYYQEIALPVALDTIESKLNHREYPTLSALESDFKRLVSNAKAFNERTSEIFNDAEKIRKMVSNYMVKFNPAYKDGSGYTPFPTPIPGEARTKTVNNADVDADGETDPEAPSIVKPRRTVTLHGPSAEKEELRLRASSTPAVQDAADAGESFEGNTFQQAQEKIVTEMIQLKNEVGEIISGPFLNLPSRELRDYYQVIKHPVCLKSIQKLVRGIKGRDKPTGVSFFKSWAAFEEEMSYIWINARTYNQDGSEIFELASEFEAYFNKRMSEAKQVVAEPTQPKVKLRMPINNSAKPSDTPKITLRIGQKSNGKANGITIDDEALKRQKDLVEGSTNGRTSIDISASAGSVAHNSSTGPVPSSSNTTISSVNSTVQNRPSDNGPLPAGPINGVKVETQTAKSPLPALEMARKASNTSSGTTQSPHLAATSMPPPAITTPRLPSGSPHPQAIHTSQIYQPANPLESRWRLPGKTASDALMPNLTVATHPALKINNRLHLDIPPSNAAIQQSVTFNLPKTHYCLQVTPTLASNLAYRQSKVFVTVNNQRLSPTPMKPEDADPRRPLYDFRVVPGVNRIEIEVIAGPPRGAPKIGVGQDIEIERVTMFVNVFR